MFFVLVPVRNEMWKLPRIVGHKVISEFVAVRRIVAFALISLGVLLGKWRVATRVILPLIKEQIVVGGVRLVPLFAFLGIGVGFVIIGQMVSWLSKVGATGYLGTVMVVVVIRELGPMLSALVVLARAGAATVVELATARATGEVEVLESMGIDPVHYLVVPRLVGLALNVFTLTVYFLLVVLFAGYFWAFIQDVPITPGQYFGQLASALRWLDFVVVGLKTIAFGGVLAMVTCYHGLARPLDLEQVSRATVRAVGHTVVGLLGVDVLFLLLYLV